MNATGVGMPVSEVLSIADRVYSFKFGRIAFEGRPGELIEDKSRLKGLFL
jgi:ABC-type lipopolysaccharide export system ATPase subunit